MGWKTSGSVVLVPQFSMCVKSEKESLASQALDSVHPWVPGQELAASWLNSPNQSRENTEGREEGLEGEGWEGCCKALSHMQQGGASVNSYLLLFPLHRDLPRTQWLNSEH